MILRDLLDRVPRHYFIDPGHYANIPIKGNVVFSEIQYDSRLVQPGDIFIAISGVAVDGHRYIPSALKNGACAVIGELPRNELPAPIPDSYIQVKNSREVLGWLYAALKDFPARKMTLIGITGTDGKTTTTNLLYHILLQAGLNVGMVSTVNARIGQDVFDTGLHVTTPDAPQVQALLTDMCDAGVTHAVLEVTSHGLAQGRLAGCEFDVAVITNITHEHLDYHGSWEAYADAKAMLFRNVATQGTKPQRSKSVVLNLDDVASYRVLSDIESPRRYTYGIERAEADVCATDVRFTPSGLHFTLTKGDVSTGIHSTLVGMYNVSNILAAASAAIALGLNLDVIRAGIAALAGVPGRMERLDEGQDFLALVDFAHTPNALKRTLETAYEMVSNNGRVIVVFGSAGLRDLAKRRMMGEVAGEFADKIVITAEDPRTESLDAIMRDIAVGVENHQRVAEQDYWCVPDRGAAIRFAVDMARRGDIVLACGKGHEQSMCFGTIEYPWDDREALRVALQGGVLSTLPTAEDAP